MKVAKTVLIVLVLCSISLVSLSCASGSDSESVSGTQAVTVQRGDLAIDITASGNLTLSLKEDLAFNIPAGVTEITVEEVLVEEGESVEEGQLLAKLDTSEWTRALRDLERQVTTKKRDLLQAQINLENAELDLEEAEDGTSTTITGDIVSRNNDPKEIDIKELQVELAEARVADAEDALAEAQQDLEDAQATSPEITAAFAGFITTVNVEGGDEVRTGTVAVQLADPNKFEADILVSEMDIVQVKLGGEARVQVDAMQGLSLPAEVTHISPTAAIQSGVVNYKVKVEVQPLAELVQERQQARQEAMQQGQEEQEGQQQPVTSGQGRQQGQVTTIPENFQLREGLTVTVSIIAQERSDVLLVPNGAITSQRGQTYVQVLAPDGTTEERTITTGISNWQYTEVIDGLSEGEQVVIPQGAATTTTQQQGPPGGFIPGIGRLGQ